MIMTIPSKIELRTAISYPFVDNRQRQELSIINHNNCNRDNGSSLDIKKDDENDDENDDKDDNENSNDDKEVNKNYDPYWSLPQLRVPPSTQSNETQQQQQQQPSSLSSSSLQSPSLPPQPKLLKEITYLELQKYVSKLALIINNRLEFKLQHVEKRKEIRNKQNQSYQQQQPKVALCIPRGPYLSLTVAALHSLAIRAFTTAATSTTLSTLTPLDKDNNNEDTNNNSDNLDKYIDNNDTDDPHSFFSPIIIPMDPKIEGIHRLRAMINDCQPDILLVVGEYDLIYMQEEVLENVILSSLASVKNERQQQTNNDNKFVVDVIGNNNSVYRVTAPSPPTTTMEI